MSHHEHDHDHHHHDTKSELTFDKKLIKLLDHWLKHNEDHAQTYLDWAQRAKQHNLEGIGEVLEEVGDLTAEISKKFKMAASLINK